MISGNNPNRLLRKCGLRAIKIESRLIVRSTFRTRFYDMTTIQDQQRWRRFMSTMTRRANAKRKRKRDPLRAGPNGQRMTCYEDQH